VLTMVTRDDLPDGGASHVAGTIKEIRRLNPGIGIEVLISDLKGDAAALGTVLDAGPEVLNHNLETIFRLYPEVRPQADYQGSLQLINRAHEAGSVTKSGLMLGLGEQEQEVLTALEDLRAAGCDLLTLGQYLAPSRRHHPVVRYVTPEEFQVYEEKALAIGIQGGGQRAVGAKLLPGRGAIPQGFGITGC
jgi:lipoic acid synthetase